MPRPLRLSTRVTLFFGLMALLGGMAFTVATYLFARTSFLQEQVVSARQEALDHAIKVNSVLSEDKITVENTVYDLETAPGGFALLWTSPNFPERQRPLASRQGFSAENLPKDLIETVKRGQHGQKIYRGADGKPWLAIGVHLAAYNVGYFEGFPLDDTETTLQALITALIVGSVLATIIAVIFGWTTSRQMLQPIARVADAASDIASGSLDTRMAPESDPDLNRLAGSFNEMANTVEERIAREQRFASDVSHELRSPITALTAAVEVLNARRDELDARTRQALEVVVGQVRRFDSMVIDLLDLSRLEAGAPDLHNESVNVIELCERVAARTGYTELPVEADSQARARVSVDRVRFERILSNLLDNAAHHGGGPTRISIEPGDEAGFVLMVVEDDGPGVSASERDRIFERFARGSAARNRIGTGLGLALVAEHAAALGGRAWCENRPGGGSRFVVAFPAEVTS